MSSSSSSPAPERALVLGGGGSTGNAWLIGLLAGLAEAGVDVTAAGLTIGTSAGSTAAVQVVGTALPELYAAALVAPDRHRPTGAPGPRPNPGRPVPDQLQRLRATIADSSDLTDFRRRMGAAALELDASADGSWSPRWRSTVAARLPGARWPERRVLVTAVDARSGQPVTFDRDSGVDVVDAVAASCSSGLPYRIGDELYIDGGYRANAENADLAAGAARVLVLSPFGGRSLHPFAWGTHLQTQVDALRADGSEVLTVFPTPDAEHLFGERGMDLSLRPDAARAGHDQGHDLAASVAGFWQ